MITHMPGPLRTRQQQQQQEEAKNSWFLRFVMVLPRFRRIFAASPAKRRHDLHRGLRGGTRMKNLQFFSPNRAMPPCLLSLEGQRAPQFVTGHRLRCLKRRRQRRKVGEVPEAQQLNSTRTVSSVCMYVCVCAPRFPVLPMNLLSRWRPVDYGRLFDVPLELILRRASWEVVHLCLLPSFRVLRCKIFFLCTACQLAWVPSIHQSINL